MSHQVKILSTFALRYNITPFELCHVALNGTLEELVQVLNKHYIKTILVSFDSNLFYKLYSLNAIQKEDFIRKNHIKIRIYLLRLSTRSTPFALSSTLASAAITEKERVSVKPNNMCYFDLDYKLLMQMIDDYLGENPDQEKYYMNPFYYNRNQWCHVYDQDFRSQEQMKKSIISRGLHNHIRENLTVPSTREEIVLFLKSGPAAKNPEDVFEKLVQSKVILPLRRPAVQGSNLFHWTTHFYPQVTERLKQVAHCFNEGVSFSEAETVIQDIIEILDTDASTEEKTFSVMLFDEKSEFNLSMSLADQATLSSVVKYLYYLSKQNHLNPMLGIDEKIAEYYDSHQIPLMEVIDPAITLIRNNHGDQRRNKNPLFDNLLNAYSYNSRILNLSEDDIKCESTSIIEESFDLFCYVYNKIETKGEKFYVIGPRFGVSPAGRALGRFARSAHFNKQYSHIHKDIRKFMINKSTELIELRFALDRQRSNNVATGNAQNRRVISSIPGIGQDTIPLDELYLIRSTHGYKIVEKTTGKTLKFVSSNLLNFQHANLFYHTLHEFSYRNSAHDLTLSLVPFHNAVFIPRIQYKNVVLMPARWKIPEIDGKSIEEWWTCFKNYVVELNVPYHLQVGNSDQLILIDLLSQNSKEILYSLVKDAKDQSVFAFESFTSENSLIIKSDLGKHISECIFSFYSENSTEPLVINRLEEYSGNKRVGFDEQWAYLKVYCADSHANEILLNISNLLGGILDLQFFFVRYFDSDYHLRLRFFSRSASIQESMKKIFELLTSLENKGVIRYFTSEKFYIEYDRYGANLNVLSLCHEFFIDDSSMIIQKILNGALNEKDSKILTGSRGIFEYLCAICNFSELPTFISEIRNENEQYSRDKAQESKYYNSIRKQLYENFSQRITEFESGIRKIKEINNLTGIKGLSIIKSLFHMHCNRLGLNRNEEYLVYYILERMISSLKHYNPFGERVYAEKDF